MSVCECVCDRRYCTHAPLFIKRRSFLDFWLLTAFFIIVLYYKGKKGLRWSAIDVVDVVVGVCTIEVEHDGDVDVDVDVDVEERTNEMGNGTKRKLELVLLLTKERRCVACVCVCVFVWSFVVSRMIGQRFIVKWATGREDL